MYAAMGDVLQWWLHTFQWQALILIRLMVYKLKRNRHVARFRYWLPDEYPDSPKRVSDHVVSSDQCLHVVNTIMRFELTFDFICRSPPPLKLTYLDSLALMPSLSLNTIKFLLAILPDKFLMDTILGIFIDYCIPQMRYFYKWTLI